MSEIIINFIFSYIIIWWILLFMVLPFGIERDDAPEPANDKGAPKNPKLKKKFLITSLLALIVTSVWIFIL